MGKKLTFKDYLEKERNREDILKSSSRLDEVLESARRINDISLSNSALNEISQRNNKLNSIIDNSAYSSIQKAIDSSFFKSTDSMIDASAFKSISESIDTSLLQSVSTKYKSIFNSISPISEIYSSELQKLRSSFETIGLKSFINSDEFIEAKNLQSELIKFEPDIGILPITTIEKSIKSEDPDIFEKATKEIHSIEIVEQIRVSNSDIPYISHPSTSIC